MKTNFKKIASLSSLIFVLGFVGAFLGKSFEKTKLGQKIDKGLGLNADDAKRMQVATGSACVAQGEKDSDSLFVGCNGFF